MTYSIVARDARTGAFGVGVQTHQPSVGAIVPWVRDGIGAIATQSFANIAFGPQALALLETGMEAPRALAAIIAGDTMPGRRQVAIVDAAGVAAVHTGDECIPYAGHIIGDGYSCQANMMTNAGVPEAMAAAYEATDGLLTERIMAALEAAQEAGGDIRGSQSAAIVIRAAGGLSRTWDMRIDNSREPLRELRTLVNAKIAGQILAEIHPDTPFDEAMATFGRANALHPWDEQTFWFAVNTLTALERPDEAVAMLEPLFARAPQWRELLGRMELPGALALRPRFGL